MASPRIITAPLPLPDRPRLSRPAWRRAPDAVQFGLRPGAASVLDGLTPPLVRLVLGLDGTRGVSRVVAEAAAAGASPDAARALLDALHHTGLLTGPTAGAGPGSRAGSVVVVHGGGRIGVALAGLLVASGVGRVRVAASGTVLADDTGTGLSACDIGRPAVRAAAEALGRAGGPAVLDAATARRATTRPDLVVLAAGAHPDPVVAAELVTARRAHLAVGVDDETPGAPAGLVGPLVLPGRSACLRCDDLARAAVDPAWPRVAAELAGSRPVVPVTLAATVAAVAAEQVLALLDAGPAGPGPDDRPASLGAVLRLDPRGGGWTREPRRVWPGCGCGAPPESPVESARPPTPVPALAADLPPATSARREVGGAA